MNYSQLLIVRTLEVSDYILKRSKTSFIFEFSGALVSLMANSVCIWESSWNLE